MTRERISATVEPNVKEQLEREDVNTSGLVNRLLKQHLQAGGDSEEMLLLRKEQLQSEIEQHESSIETLEKQLNQVNERLAQIREEQQSDLQEAMHILESVPWQKDNPAIQNHAEELDMTPEDLINQLEDYHA